MIRRTKNFVTHVMRELKSQLKDKSTNPATVGLLKSTAEIICDREDVSRIKTLIRYYKISRNSDYIDVKQFYYWIKDKPISVEDETVYEVFDAVSENLQLRQADPTHFSELGAILLQSIRDWKGDSGNTELDILIEYFSVTIKKSLEFNRSISTSPKSLLGNFGWNIFEEYIDNTYGGKFNYFVASKDQINKAKKDQTLLFEIQKIKDQLLQAGFLKEYDRIGQILTYKSIDEVYACLKE